MRRKNVLLVLAGTLLILAFFLNAIPLQVAGDETVIVNCDSLTGWIGAPLGAFTLSISVDSVEGAGSVELTALGGNYDAWASWYAPWPDGINLADSPTLKFNLKPLNLVDCQVFFELVTFTDPGIGWNGYTYPELTSSLTEDVWGEVTIDLPSSPSGTPDLTLVRAFMFNMRIFNAPLDKVLLIDNIRKVYGGTYVAPLRVTVSPDSASVGEGESETFAASVFGGVSPYSYSWSLDGVVEGVTSMSYRSPSTLTAGTYSVTCTVTDANLDAAPSTASVLYVTSATPSAEQFTLSITSTIEGSTSPAEGNYTYNSGTIVSVEALPEDGYVFDGWLLDGETNLTDNPTEVTMNGDHTLQAAFQSSGNHTVITPPPLSLPQDAIFGLSPISFILTVAGATLGVIAVLSKRKEPR